MKQTKTLFFIATVLLLLMGCSKDEQDTVTKETINVAGKWFINSGGYSAIEFTNQQNYILVRENVGGKNTANSTVKKAANILYGSYKIIDNQTIELENLGKITNVTTQNNKISFTFNSNKMSGNKATPIETSLNTDLLCQKWKLSSMITNGEDKQEYVGSTIIFTKYNTYFMNNIKSGYSLNQWKWKNNNEKSILYKRGTETYGSNNVLEILLITKDSLKINEENYIYTLTRSR